MVLTTGRVRLDLWYKALTVHLTIFVSTSDFEDGRIESRRRAKYLLRLSHLFFFSYWTFYSRNNLSSYFGLIDVKISASKKEQLFYIHICKNLEIKQILGWAGWIKNVGKIWWRHFMLKMILGRVLLFILQPPRYSFSYFD